METSKSEHEVLINAEDLADGARILEFGNRVLFDGKDNAVGSLETNSAGASVNSFEGVLNLKELTIRGEDSDCFIVL